MAWPYRSVLCPPPWDDCGGQEERAQSENRLPLTHLAYPKWEYAPHEIPCSGLDMRKLQFRHSADPLPQVPTCGSRDSVPEKPVDEDVYVPQNPFLLSAAFTLLTRPQSHSGWLDISAWY